MGLSCCGKGFQAGFIMVLVLLCMTEVSSRQCAADLCEEMQEDGFYGLSEFFAPPTFCAAHTLAYIKPGGSAKCICSTSDNSFGAARFNGKLVWALQKPGGETYQGCPKQNVSGLALVPSFTRSNIQTQTQGSEHNDTVLEQVAHTTRTSINVLAQGSDDFGSQLGSLRSCNSELCLEMSNSSKDGYFRITSSGELQRFSSGPPGTSGDNKWESVCMTISQAQFMLDRTNGGEFQLTVAAPGHGADRCASSYGRLLAQSPAIPAQHSAKHFLGHRSQVQIPENSEPTRLV